MRRGAVTDWAPVFAALEKEGMEVSEQMERIREVAGSGRLSIADGRERGGLTSAGEAGGLEVHDE